MKSGNIYGFYGRNGSGKTMFLELLQHLSIQHQVILRLIKNQSYMKIFT
ncbi:MAG TPA: hypothetical protein GX747_02290 [Tenericutes bacterium]|nr:hypothetical protein [Mycoplasmatota bacterium]